MVGGEGVELDSSVSGGGRPADPSPVHCVLPPGVAPLRRFRWRTASIVRYQRRPAGRPGFPGRGTPLRQMGDAVSDSVPTVRAMTELELLPPCDVQTALTPAEHTYLEDLPDPAHSVVAKRHCDLQRSHAGCHVSLGQESAGTSWWVVWGAEDERPCTRETEATARLYQMEDCPAQTSGSDPEWCLLPQQHEGAHSFALEPSPSAQEHRKLAAALHETTDEQLAALDEMGILLALAGPPLPLLTKGEATALVMLLRMTADANWLAAEIAEQIVERVQARLGALS